MLLLMKSTGAGRCTGPFWAPRSFDSRPLRGSSGQFSGMRVFTERTSKPGLARPTITRSRDPTRWKLPPGRLMVSPASFVLHDVGVVLLQFPVASRPPNGVLPAANQLDSLKTRAATGLTFTAVGYGLRRPTPASFWHITAGRVTGDTPPDPDQRRHRRRLLIAALEQRQYWGNLFRGLRRSELRWFERHRDESGRRGNIVRTERKLRRHRRCVPHRPPERAGLHQNFRRNLAAVEQLLRPSL